MSNMTEISCKKNTQKIPSEGFRRSLLSENEALNPKSWQFLEDDFPILSLSFWSKHGFLVGKVQLLAIELPFLFRLHLATGSVSVERSPTFVKRLVTSHLSLSLHLPWRKKIQLVPKPKKNSFETSQPIFFYLHIVCKWLFSRTWFHCHFKDMSTLASPEWSKPCTVAPTSRASTSCRRADGNPGEILNHRSVAPIFHTLNIGIAKVIDMNETHQPSASAGCAPFILQIHVWLTWCPRFPQSHSSGLPMQVSCKNTGSLRLLLHWGGAKWWKHWQIFPLFRCPSQWNVMPKQQKSWATRGPKNTTFAHAVRKPYLQWFSMIFYFTPAQQSLARQRAIENSLAESRQGFCPSNKLDKDAQCVCLVPWV